MDRQNIEWTCRGSSERSGVLSLLEGGGGTIPQGPLRTRPPGEAMQGTDTFPIFIVLNALSPPDLRVIPHSLTTLYVFECDTSMC